MKRTVISRFVLVLMCITSVPCLGDRIVLNSGKEIEGVVVKEESDGITIERQGMRMVLPRSQVQRIEKVSSADNAIAEGDRQMAAGAYEKAMALYTDALKERPAEAQRKLREVQEAMATSSTAKIQKHLKDLSLEEQEDWLRRSVADKSLPDFERISLKRELSRLLAEEAARSADRLNPIRQQELLDEAQRLDPTSREATLPFVQNLSARNPKDPRIEEALKTYLAANPDDIQAIQLFAQRVSQTDPWAVVSLAYPKGRLRTGVSTELKGLLSAALQAAFATGAAPAGAPLDLAACYEQLMILKPGTSPLPLLRLRLTQNPNSAEAHGALGECLLHERIPEEAVDRLRRSMELQADEKTAALLEQARQALEKATLEKARQDLDKKQPEAAQVECEKALVRMPENVEVAKIQEEARHLARCESCLGTGKAICPTCSGSGWTTSSQTYEEPTGSGEYLGWRVQGEFDPSNQLVVHTTSVFFCGNCREQCGVTREENTLLALGITTYDLIKQRSAFGLSMVRSPGNRQDNARTGVPDVLRDLTRVSGNRQDPPLEGLMSFEAVKDLLEKYKKRGMAPSVETLKPPAVKSCPKCQAPWLVTKQRIITPPCKACSGTGSTGVCPKCSGNGMIQLTQPRETRTVKPVTLSKVPGS